MRVGGVQSIVGTPYSVLNSTTRARPVNRTDLPMLSSDSLATSSIKTCSISGLLSSVLDRHVVHFLLWFSINIMLLTPVDVDIKTDPVMLMSTSPGLF